MKYNLLWIITRGQFSDQNKITTCTCMQSYWYVYIIIILDHYDPIVNFATRKSYFHILLGRSIYSKRTININLNYFLIIIHHKSITKNTDYSTERLAYDKSQELTFFQLVHSHFIIWKEAAKISYCCYIFLYS